MSTAVAPTMTPVQRTTIATRCDRMGVCLSLHPPCPGCDLVRGCKPAPKPLYPTTGLSPAELPYLKREHSLCAVD